MRAVERHGTGERARGRKERDIDRVCVAVCAVTVDMELANEA